LSEAGAGETCQHHDNWNGRQKSNGGIGK